MDLTPWATANRVWISTIGRRSGEWRDKWWIVFAVDGSRLYLMEETGHSADWIKNIAADGRVRVWIDGHEPIDAMARVVEPDDPDDQRVRAAMAASPVGSTLRDLTEWGLPVVVET